MFNPKNCSPEQMAAIEWLLNLLNTSYSDPDDFGAIYPLISKWHADNVLAMINVKE